MKILSYTIKKGGKSMKIKSYDIKLKEYEQYLSSLPFICTEKIESEKTVFVMVDIINGFIREGVLHDKEIENIITPVKAFLEYCKRKNIKSIAFSDCHSEDSCEFATFPLHCIKGNSECKIVDELTQIGGFEIIEKNSVNGFHASGFRKFIENNMDKSCYIVCGDCTDICVLNFCLSLKTFFNEINKSAEILVPLSMTETFHTEKHNRSFANISALSVMETNGIKLIGGIEINE